MFLTAYVLNSITELSELDKLRWALAIFRTLNSRGLQRGISTAHYNKYNTHIKLVLLIDLDKIGSRKMAIDNKNVKNIK